MTDKRVAKFVNDVGLSTKALSLDGFIAGIAVVDHNIVIAIPMTDTEKGREVAARVGKELVGARFGVKE